MDKQPLDRPDADIAWWRGGLQSALALPASVRICGMSLAAADFRIDGSAPGPDLPVQLARASVKRKTEYLAGRHCAAAALKAADCADASPPAMGEDRLPLWPAGWLGSISHGGGQAAAAVMRRPDAATGDGLLGIDIEVLIDPASVAGIGELVALDGELKLLTGCTPSQALTLLFSAKETLYKALYPAVQRFMDFSAARVSAFGPGALTLTLTEDWHPAWRVGASLSVRYAMRGEYVYTALHAP
jgi:enterobactin synthetase component D